MQTQTKLAQNLKILLTLLLIMPNTTTYVFIIIDTAQIHVFHRV